AFLNNVLSINPDNNKAREWHTATRSLLAKTFVQRAIAAREDGRPEQAQSWLDGAISHGHHCVSAWMERAAFADNDDEKAEIFARGLEIDPQHTEARSRLGSIETIRTEQQVDARTAA